MLRTYYVGGGLTFLIPRRDPLKKAVVFPRAPLFAHIHLVPRTTYFAPFCYHVVNCAVAVAKDRREKYSGSVKRVGHNVTQLKFRASEDFKPRLYWQTYSYSYRNT